MDENSVAYSSLRDIKDEEEYVFDSLTDDELLTMAESLEFAFDNPIDYGHN